MLTVSPIGLALTGRFATSNGKEHEAGKDHAEDAATHQETNTPKRANHIDNSHLH